MNNVIFDNNKWIIGWIKNNTQLRIESKEGKGHAIAYLVGTPFDYGDMDWLRRAPRIEYTNGVIVPAYIRAKITLAFARGKRWR